MKKALCVLLCLLLVLPLAACKKGGDPNTIFVNTESTTESENDIKDTVKVSFPLSVIEEEYRDDLDAYCEKYGYKSAKVNSDGTVSSRVLEIGRHLGDRYEILSGLEKGEIVVTSGQSALRDGSKVEVLK